MDASAAHIEDVLAREGVYVSTTVGVSMWPLLRDRRDTVVVTPAHGRLRVGDVPLYRRGDAYVLHRCVEVGPDAYTMLGDNCLAYEYGVTDAQVIGVLTGLYRDDRPVDLDGAGYRAYVRAWALLRPARRAWKRVRLLLGRVRRAARGVTAAAAGDRAPGAGADALACSVGDACAGGASDAVRPSAATPEGDRACEGAAAAAGDRVPGARRDGSRA